MSITPEAVNQAISTVVDDNLQTDYVSARSVKNIQIDGNDVSLTIEMGYPAKSLHEFIRNRVTAALRKIDGIGKIHVDVDTKIVTHEVQRGVKPLPDIKNIIAVSSGKGGVGKSTTTANLALALAAEGARVGILDADIYGPSQPSLMGISEKPTSSDGKNMDPIIQYGLQLMSIGFMMDSVQPLAWRAPMITQAVMQLLQQTKWQDLDYLLIDMPPGTGRHSADAVAKSAFDGGDCGDDTTGCGCSRRQKRLDDVPENECRCSGHCRKHEFVCLFTLRADRAYLRQGWRQADE